MLKIKFLLYILNKNFIHYFCIDLIFIFRIKVIINNKYNKISLLFKLLINS